MAKLGIIGGTGLFSAKAFSTAKWEQVQTEYGTVQIIDRDPVVLLQRHGMPPIPPHAINHKANIAALEEEGVTRIAAFNSVGSMKADLKLGTLLLPDDFISLWDIPTFYDTECHFTTPKIDAQLHRLLGSLLTNLKVPHQTTGVYWQSRGPRFETKAEIKMMAHYADIVGMTMASEATLAGESEIPYAAICSVDNYANGIKDITIHDADVEKGKAQNLAHVEKILGALMEGKW